MGSRWTTVRTFNQRPTTCQVARQAGVSLVTCQLSKLPLGLVTGQSGMHGGDFPRRGFAYGRTCEGRRPPRQGRGTQGAEESAVRRSGVSFRLSRFCSEVARRCPSGWCPDAVTVSSANVSSERLVWMAVIMQTSWSRSSTWKGCSAASVRSALALHRNRSAQRLCRLFERIGLRTDLCRGKD